MSEKTTCVLDELAHALASNDVLKAVWVDGEKRSLSVATRPGGTTDPVQDHLREILRKYEAHPSPACPDPIRRCPTCDKLSQRTLPPGIKLVTLPGSGILLEKESCDTAMRFWTWRQFPWVEVKVREIDPEHIGGGKVQLLLALACGALTLAGFIVEKATGELTLTALALYIGAYLAGGWFAVQEVWGLLLRRVLDVHFLMIAVAAGAAVIGHWWEGAVLLFLFSLSDALEDFAMGRTEREIKSLFRDAPREAVTLLPNGGEHRVPVDSLRPGARIRIRPGDQVPVDAEVVDGVSAADESNLTGESLPVDKKIGDRVLAGTMNLWGRVDAVVVRPASESSLRKIIRLIQEAQESKAPSQRFTDRFGSGYTLSVLAGCAAMFLVWWLGSGMTATDAFYRTMTLLVVASPCALVLSIPSAILAGIACGARKGVLFRGGSAIEKLAEVRRVAFDKTGTLTTGHLHVTAVESVPPGREDDLLAHAASLATNSMHPVSQAIAREARQRRVPVKPVAAFRSLTGEGVEGRIGDDPALSRMGRRSLFGGADWTTSWPELEIGFTETLVSTPTAHGRIVLRDEVRTESARLVAALAASGLQPTMLTGDRPEAAALVSRHLGLTDIRAGLSPDDKVAQIQGWMKGGELVAMVGDGVNDAPSLAAAHVGVAMGMRGSDAALEQADVVLMRDRIERFLFAFRLSRKARSIIRQNLAISLGSVAVLVCAAFFGAIPLTVGVIGHEGSTVVVVLNSLRLLWFRESIEESD